jgi:hypothetical protein
MLTDHHIAGIAHDGFSLFAVALRADFAGRNWVDSEGGLCEFTDATKDRRTLGGNCFHARTIPQTVVRSNQIRAGYKRLADF